MKDIQSMQSLLANFSENPILKEKFQKAVRYNLEHPDVQVFLKKHEDQVSDEMIMSSMSKLNEYVEEMDKLKRGESGKNPGFVPVLFMNDHYIDVAYQETLAHQEKTKKLKEKSFVNNRMMSRDVRNASFTSLDLESPDRYLVNTKVLKFMEQYQEDPYKAKGLYLTGPYGIGKTYILGALANEMAHRGVNVSLVHFPTFVTELKAEMKSNQVYTLLEEVKVVDILMIDDIGAEQNTAWVRDEVLTSIVEYRMKEMLPTFFSSNLSMADLVYHLQETKDVLDKNRALRVMERIKFLSSEVKMSGENLRQKLRGE